jgi:hypothetical protein
MSNIEIVNEPEPPARASGKGVCDLSVRLIDGKNGELLKTCPTKGVKENERQLRESRKY